MATEDDVIGDLECTFHDAGQRQLETLDSILERNAGVSYLWPLLGGGDAKVDAGTYRITVPLSEYDDYADYIDKLAD